MPDLEGLQIRIVDENNNPLPEYGHKDSPPSCYIEAKDNQRFMLSWAPQKPFKHNEIHAEAQKLGVFVGEWICCECIQANDADKAVRCTKCNHLGCYWCTIMTYHFALMERIEVKDSLLPPYDLWICMYLDGNEVPITSRGLYMDLIRRHHASGSRTISGRLEEDPTLGLVRRPYIFKELTTDCLEAVLGKETSDLSEDELIAEMRNLDDNKKSAPLGEIHITVQRVVYEAFRKEKLTDVAVAAGTGHSHVAKRRIIAAEGVQRPNTGLGLADPLRLTNGWAPYDPAEGLVASFRIRYRSKEILQKMGLMP